MERQIVLRCALFGVLGGILSYIFATIYAEPIINRAIDYEGARDAAQHALEMAENPSGHSHEDGGELFSRSVQSTAGIATGLIVMGIALGLLYAVVLSLYIRFARPQSKKGAAITVAALMFAATYIIPSLKYPANPPAIGHEDTIKQRTMLFLIMVVASALCMVGAFFLYRVLKTKVDPQIAGIVACVAFVVVMVAIGKVLPPLGELSANVSEFGHHNSETPLPLKDPAGNIVFPGFPADDLYYFRLYSFITQLILWGTLAMGAAMKVKRIQGFTSVAPQKNTEVAQSAV